MKTYEAKIQELVTYWQEGTVTVQAENKREARKLILAGKYEHEGDNEVLLDTEGPCQKREIVKIDNGI